MNHATLCVLSYGRLDLLRRSLDSLWRNTHYPYELIVHDDGSDKDVTDWLYSQYKWGKISFLILNGGKNMGIGAAMHRCVDMASGEYIFKLDADLEYFPHWLEKSVAVLQNNRDVVCMGLFDYFHYDPLDERFGKIESRKDCIIVEDFVASAYGAMKYTYDFHGAQLGDDGWQQYLKNELKNPLIANATRHKLAIPKDDVVYNFGFGERSIFVQNGKVTKKSSSSKIFNESNNSAGA